MVNLQDIIDSHGRIKKLVHRTPILTNSGLDELIGAKIYCKCENFQKTGAFKFRGASNAVELLSEKELTRGVATASSGNHGAALAKAVTRKNGNVTVIMPNDSSLINKETVSMFNLLIKITPIWNAIF